MIDSQHPGVTRREVLHTAGAVAAASALAGVAIPAVHAAERQHHSGGPRRLRRPRHRCRRQRPVQSKTARSSSSPWPTSSRTGSNPATTPSSGWSIPRPARSTCPKSRQFLGFDAYKQAMDCLRPGDVVILATPPAFRWVHFTYAIEKGVNVFMEKPITVDGPSTRRMLKLGEESVQAQPQGRRRPHVPPLRRPRRTVRTASSRGADRRHRAAAGLPADGPRRDLRLEPPSPRASASWCTRSAASTRSCGPAAAATAIS